MTCPTIIMHYWDRQMTVTVQKQLENLRKGLTPKHQAGTRMRVATPIQ